MTCNGTQDTACTLWGMNDRIFEIVKGLIKWEGEVVNFKKKED